MIAPAIVRKIGAPNGLLMGVFGYLFYTVGCWSAVPFLYLFSSLVIGLAAGILWTSSGSNLTFLSTPSNRGTHSAFIVGAIRCAPIFSNSLLGYLLHATIVDPTTGAEIPRYSAKNIFAVLFFIGSGSIVAFAMLKIRSRKVQRMVARAEAELERREREEAALSRSRINTASEQELNAAEQRATALMAPPAVPPPPAVPAPAAPSSGTTVQTPVSLLQRASEIFKLTWHPNYRHIFPCLTLLQGAGNGFFFGVYGVTIGRAYLGYVHVVMGSTAVTTILIIGRVLDRIPHNKTDKKKYFAVFTMCVHMGFLIIASIVSWNSNGFTSRAPYDSYPKQISDAGFSFLVYSSVVWWGLCWAGTDITMYYYIGQGFSTQGETAFAAKAFWESVGFVIAQIVPEIAGARAYPIIALVWAVPVLFYYTRWKFPTELMHSKSLPAQARQEPGKWHK
jgi:hypothetical protein